MSKVFSLEGRVLKLNSAADIEPHIKELRDNADVEEVIFQGNTLGIEASKALAEVLKEKKNLKIANLCDIFTGRLREEIPEALTYLLTALLKCTQCHTVNLSDNAFGLLTEKPLIDFLSNHIPLQHLILNNNGLGPNAGTHIANSLTELAGKKKTAGGNPPPLETVVCGRNRLENGSMAAWAKAYAANDGIKVIRMVQNGIRQEGIEHLLTEGLSRCDKLEILDLQDNTFTIKGAVALSSVLGKWSSLRELGVGDCLLGARGGVILAESLKANKNPDIKVLRLQYNDIDQRGVTAIRDCLKVSLKKLELLELNGNKFSDEDPVIEEIREIFEERGLGELDSLSDLEEESEEEEDEDETDDNATEKNEDVVKDAEAEENENVAPEKDKGVDDLADALKKTEIKET